MPNLRRISASLLLSLVLSLTAQANSVSGERLTAHLAALMELGKLPNGGTTRLAYSAEDKAARTLVMAWMRTAGLKPEIDAAGNIVGKLPGSQPGLKPIVTGSHLDTVPEGGNFDGIVGSLAAIEVAQALSDGHKTLKHPLEVIVFQNEEGGHLGSRAITSGLSPADLQFRSLSGKEVNEGIAFLGGDPKALDAARRAPQSIAAFIELHIEQGETLERKKKSIGVVEGIVGISRWAVTVEGVANHAGTTPMKYRRDALVASAKLIDFIFETTKKLTGQQVATVGKIEAKPGAPNVVPGKVEFTFETRDLDQAKIDALFAKVQARAKQIEQATKTTFQFARIYQTDPVLTDKSLQRAIEAQAKSLGLTTFALPSGAGHDAQEFRNSGPLAMIFIPSQGGVSHSPLEFSSAEDILAGTRVLLSTIEARDVTLP